jgi:hypothetical protein
MIMMMMAMVDDDEWLMLMGSLYWQAADLNVDNFGGKAMLRQRARACMRACTRRIFFPAISYAPAKPYLFSRRQCMPYYFPPPPPPPQNPPFSIFSSASHNMKIQNTIRHSTVRHHGHDRRLWYRLPTPTLPCSINTLAANATTHRRRRVESDKLLPPRTSLMQSG